MKRIMKKMCLAVAMVTVLGLSSGIAAAAYGNNAAVKAAVSSAIKSVADAEKVIKLPGYNTMAAQTQLNTGLKSVQRIKTFGKAYHSVFSILNARLTVVKARIQAQVSADQAKAAKLAADKAKAIKDAQAQTDAKETAADNTASTSIADSFYGSHSDSSPLTTAETLHITAKAETVSNVSFQKDLYIEADQVSIHNTKVAGTIFIDPGKGGTTTLTGVTAKDIKVLSGGENSIHLDGARSETLEIATDQGTASDNGTVRIVIDPNTVIGSTLITSNAILCSLGHVGTTRISGGMNGGYPRVSFFGRYADPVIVTTGAAITAANTDSSYPTKIVSLQVAPQNNGSVGLDGIFASVQVIQPTTLNLSNTTGITDTLSLFSSATVNAGTATTVANMSVATANPTDQVTVSGNIGDIQINKPSVMSIGAGATIASISSTVAATVTVAPTATITRITGGTTYGIMNGSSITFSTSSPSYTRSSGPITTPLSSIGAITGTAQIGSVLTAGALSPAGASAGYQWVICDTVNGTYTNIAGATSNTYTPVAGDVSKYIRVVATGAGLYSGAVTSEATVQIAALPTHTGVLDNLTASISLEGTLNIALTDLDLGTSAAPTVKVTSSVTDTTGQTASLAWNAATGKFEGSIVVSAASGAGKIQATPGETITVTYHDAANAAGNEADITKTTTVPTHTGVLDNLAASISLEGTLNIALTDLDLGTSATPTVKVTSSVTDTTGQTASLAWNAATGKFEGSIVVSAASGAGKIQATPGETITVTYHDAVNAAGNGADITKTTAVPAHTGVLDDLAASISLEGTLNIALTDLDLGTTATPTVKVTSSVTDTTGQTASLAWNAATGKFEGSIVVSAASGVGKIQATPGETITVTYHDAANAAGNGAAITKTTAVPTHTGVLDDLVAKIGQGGTLNIALTDLDLSTTATPTVKVTSGMDVTGQTVSLVWNAGTGKFEGSILVSATSGAGKIRAAGGNTITVTYHDAANVAGIGADIVKTTSVPYTGTFSVTGYTYLGATMGIALTDLDLATTATPTVKVTSSVTDTTGQMVTLNWNPTTSKFEGSIMISETSGAGSIQAGSNETIAVTYHDMDTVSDTAADVTGSIGTTSLLVGIISGATSYSSGNIVVTLSDAAGSVDVLHLYGLNSNVITNTTGFSTNVINGSQSVAGNAGYNVGNNTGNQPSVTINLNNGTVNQTFNYTITGPGGTNLK